MNFNDMKSLAMFRGMNSGEVKQVYECFGGVVREYKKGETVIRAGDAVREIGAVVEGEARVVKTDAFGNPFGVSYLKMGGYINILFAVSRERRSTVTVEAADRLSALLFPLKKLVCQCEKACPAHQTLLCNVIDGLCGEVTLVSEHNDCLVKRTIREKVLTYLINRSNGEKGAFEIPSNRENMADYLNVDRSALSRELSNMKKDGVIDFYKNTFRILKF